MSAFSNRKNLVLKNFWQKTFWTKNYYDPKNHRVKSNFRNISVVISTKSVINNCSCERLLWPSTGESKWMKDMLPAISIFSFGTLIRKIKLFRLRDSLLIYKKIIFYPFCIIHRKYTQKTIKLFLFTHNFFLFFSQKF